MASVVAALGSNQQAVAIDRARIDRQIRELALEHAAGGLGDDNDLARLKVLREQRDAIVERTVPGLPERRAVEWLRAIAEAMQSADVSKEKADLMHAIYDGSRSPAPRSWVPADRGGLRARVGAGAAGRGCNGAPDRCWARVSNLRDPDRGAR